MKTTTAVVSHRSVVDDLLDGSFMGGISRFPKSAAEKNQKAKIVSENVQEEVSVISVVPGKKSSQFEGICWVCQTLKFLITLFLIQAWTCKNVVLPFM